MTPIPAPHHYAPGRVTESIYSSASVVVPLADVQHVEKGNPLGISVITRHTRWDREGDFWANSIWIGADEAPRFLAAWCRYRSELEADTLADLRPDADECIAERIAEEERQAAAYDQSQFGVGA